MKKSHQTAAGSGSGERDSTLSKVIVRTHDGKVHRGFSGHGYIDRAGVTVLGQDGGDTTFPHRDLKAVFFVKDFKGDQTYKTLKFLNKSPGKKWVWMRVRFSDGEVVEGRAKNDSSLFDGPGLWLWPSDEDDNNDMLFAVRAAIDQIEILEVE